MLFLGKWGNSPQLMSYISNFKICPLIYYLAKSRQDELTHYYHIFAFKVNYLALNTDYVLRTGSFDPSKGEKDEFITESNELKDKALQRYLQARVQFFKPCFFLFFFPTDIVCEKNS